MWKCETFWITAVYFFTQYALIRYLCMPKPSFDGTEFLATFSAGAESLIKTLAGATPGHTAQILDIDKPTGLSDNIVIAW